MRTRVFVILTALLVITALAAFGESAAVYPGSKLVFQVNMTDKDFIPVIRQVIPTLPGIVRSMAASGELTDVPDLPYEQMAQATADALAGLKSARASSYAVKQEDLGKIMPFYTEKMGLGSEWQTLIRVDKPGIAFGIYTTPDLDKTFGIMIQPAGYMTVETTGKIDTKPLMDVAMKIMNCIPDAPKPAPADGK